MNDELMHYGVKGMKWGVRKNRTAASSKHGRKVALKAMARIGAKTLGGLKKAASTGRVLVQKSRSLSVTSPQPATDKISKKGERLRQKALKPGSTSKDINKALNYMSNDEIKGVIERQRLQNEYRDLASLSRTKNPSLLSSTWKESKSGIARGIGGGLQKNVQKAVGAAASPVAAWAGKRAANKSAEWVANTLGKDPDAVAAAAQAAKEAFSGKKKD